ncbi:hypothetical protein MML61_27735 (plasmid) [Mycobacterium marinum]|uniref:hypothetical protein n=1 Tax=Mycobacterium marinum TaxID=1781 RepID=UPI00045FC66E|nr:hypothetical protein [Mycobacterium marinum]WCS21205.1 hypothetical protein MML61_27735 [Mycobacterium marinum]WOR07563.1 hypothetical protein QDR78_27080 [Mycobacterium marinum]CDM79557.1 hypothetical protein MMARE11_p00540 [Mycobacterium marinum E11]BBC69039.1 hypothetical protein MMRN_p0080 [Mycobacterium marinum]GJO51265.1 hypothetical protein NJB1604_39210 [Mycobacterium marinum]
MAAKFTMNVAETEAGLSAADAAVAQQSGSNLGSFCIGGYMTSLVGATIGSRALGEAQADGRAAMNTASREVCIATVQTTEAGNSGVLTT